ncbi:MAG: type II secretion system protein [bacterium]|nr:type II secretion system protein [bacterium]
MKTNKLASYRAKELGFTLVELVVTMAIVIILVVSAIAILDPVRQFAQGRNTQRKANLNVILGAIGQNLSDNKGTFSCSSGAVPTTTKRMASVATSTNYNIAPCLVTTYLNSLPYDPSTSSAHWASVSDYDTGYTILQDATSGHITVSAPAAELSSTISYTR